MTKSVCMLNSVSETLNEILSVSKIARDMKGFDFDYSSLNKKSKLVPPVKKNEFIMSNYMSQYHIRHYY